MKTLFIGNSHTFFNDLPGLYRQLCAQHGIDMHVTMLTKGGMGLDYHAREEQTRFNILFGGYDIVVLQHTAHPMGDLDAMEAGMRTIMDWVRQAGSRPILYQTWTRKGDEGSQPAMSAVYERLGRELNAEVAPVGDVWQQARRAHPEIEMYNADGAHASPEGSRLAARVIFETAFPAARSLRWKDLFQGCTGQDGAIFGDCLFRFDANAACRVYSMCTGRQNGAFTLDRADELRPHCNTVCFGAEKYASEDEYPLLYCNLYNNYAREADRLEGVCCVYRLTRSGEAFHTRLVQLIRIGFVNDLSLWKSLPGGGDCRPYGNFLVDPVRGRLHAYVLRDADRVTRYFTFDLPSAAAGEFSDRFGVRVVTLQASDIRAQFDCDYTGFIQGGCCRDGRLYSVAGFTTKTPDDPNAPKMQIVDTDAQKQLAVLDLAAAGLSDEPEMIDFAGDSLCYMDCTGAVRTLILP